MKQMRNFIDKQITNIITLFLIVFFISACTNNITGEPNSILNKMQSLNSKNEKLSHIVSSAHLKILNGGEPPKYYRKYDVEINSMEGRDIVFIEMSNSDTMIQQVFLDREMKNKVHISRSDYYLGDTLKMTFVSGDIVIQ